jgi:nucleotide-binding universal stress UspA family protein
MIEESRRPGEQGRGPRLVVVGIDGSSASLEAAGFAAGEATARRLDLLVVHAVSPDPGRIPYGAGRAADVAARRADARRLVDQALARVAVAPPTVVHRVVEAAPAGALLAAWTRAAALLVLGQPRADPGAGRLAEQVVTNARCPVAVVPADGGRSVRSTAHLGPRSVVVGLGRPGSAAPLLRLAHEEAGLRGLPLLILLASTNAHGVAEGGAVAEIVAGLRHDHPDVKTDFQLLPGETVESWVDLTSRADLLVLGRTFSLRGRRSSSHSLARALLHQARCPLVVV